MKVWNEELNEGVASGFLSEAEILRLVLLFLDPGMLLILFIKENLRISKDFLKIYQLKPWVSTKYILAGS